MSDTRSDPAAAAMTVRDAVLDLLRQFGIDKVFGNPGSTELPMFRDFPADLDYVLGLQEAVVVGMADGYAQASGRAALVNLHSAAGLGNAMGNLFTAFRNHTPLIVTAGQQARSLLPLDPYLGAQRAAELPQPYVKWSVEPARAQDVPAAIARAWRIAMQEPRGPVFVSVPVDDWDQPAEPVAPRAVSQVQGPDPEALARLGAALEASARPALVVGAALARGGAWDETVALAERHRARVFAAPVSGRCAFPEDHRLFAGFLPAMRERIVERLAGHDLVVALGAPAFTYHVEGFGPHLPDGARLWQLVDDPGVAAWTPVGDALVGNLRLALAGLLARPVPAAVTARAMPGAREAPARVGPGGGGEGSGSGGPMSVAFVMQTLAELREAADIVVEEAPSSRPAMQRHLPFTRPDSFYTMDSGGLGYAMPAAVGIALAEPGRRVIALLGDGSSLYAIQALWSAAQRRLPIAFLILANGRYAALQEFAPVFGFAAGETVQGTALPGLDFVALARGFGCEGRRVADPALLREALQAALTGPGPSLLEIVVA
ncbi:benzoylformate decarboxylase [Burkholderia gladioli pv. gladioli]|uniref:Benzoylformate decarboxylase n=1 Tax=Burkholderia gladioli TaxID=28095 RepID=A0AAW3F9E8_BURGA|nr:benzoylformate decarboxylase [Burkholderia gladioli]KGC16926.1 benzoylformate decarboxylase [Burkholderia gladioli]MDJ1161018.1 benzoylformate decarboxylase [Burkholderia gladioli pv. gladioli]